MKKGITIICSALLFVTAGCSNSSASSDSNEGYSEAYQSVLSEIETMNASTDAIVDYNVTSWDIVGANDIAYFLNMSATASDIGDVGMGSAWKTDYPLMDKVFGTNVVGAKGMTAQKNEIAEKVIPYFLAYQEKISSASDADTLIMSQIKEMKDKYSESHQDAISALSQYYLDSSSYFSYVMDVGGKSLANYTSEIATYKKTITESKKAAELAE